MGSETSEAYGHEKPAHWVTLSRPFKLQTTEMTQAQWKAEMGVNPSGPATDPMGPPSGLHRVCRGGGWACDARYARAPGGKLAPGTS